MRDIPRGPIPLIGGATVDLDHADPMDIVRAIANTMPHYAQAVGKHVATTEAMLGECVRVLRKMGINEVPRALRAPAAPPIDIGGGNGDGPQL
jgi:hypothetical protein